MHQGHPEGQPGLDHIPAVDTVTPWQVVGAVETISERHWLPVLEAIRPPFPFRILGFPCDNGPEFLHPTVARLLHKLLVEFPQSRPCRTTDNALGEGKKGAAVRQPSAATDLSLLLGRQLRCGGSPRPLAIPTGTTTGPAGLPPSRSPRGASGSAASGPRTTALPTRSCSGYPTGSSSGSRA